MKNIIGYCIFVLSVILVLHLVFTNPDMASTRLLLTYWKRWILIAVLLLVGYKLVEGE